MFKYRFQLFYSHTENVLCKQFSVEDTISAFKINNGKFYISEIILKHEIDTFKINALVKWFVSLTIRNLVNRKDRYLWREAPSCISGVGGKLIAISYAFETNWK